MLSLLIYLEFSSQVNSYYFFSVFAYLLNTGLGTRPPTIWWQWSTHSKPYTEYQPQNPITFHVMLPHNQSVHIGKKCIISALSSSSLNLWRVQSRRLLVILASYYNASVTRMTRKPQSYLISVQS